VDKALADLIAKKRAAGAELEGLKDRVRKSKLLLNNSKTVRPARPTSPPYSVLFDLFLLPLM